MSEATAARTRDTLPAGASLVDSGSHRLKDLVHAERIWLLTHPDLPSVDAPLRSLDAHRHNLPVQLTPFIGRYDELRVVAQELGHERLVTLTGAWCLGKRRRPGRPRTAASPGTWWVELAPLHDPGAVGTAYSSGCAWDRGRHPLPDRRRGRDAHVGRSDAALCSTTASTCST